MSDYFDLPPEMFEELLNAIKNAAQWNLEQTIKALAPTRAPGEFLYQPPINFGGPPQDVFAPRKVLLPDPGLPGIENQHIILTSVRTTLPGSLATVSTRAMKKLQATRIVLHRMFKLYRLQIGGETILDRAINSPAAMVDETLYDVPIELGDRVAVTAVNAGGVPAELWAQISGR